MRRGSLIVIPIGRALLYAEPIYLQAERSPMPELRHRRAGAAGRLVYGPTFEAAMAALFGNGSSTLSTPGGVAAAAAGRPAGRARRRRRRRRPPTDADSLISEAARDLADYQRLTAEGKLGEAGQRSKR